MSFLLSILTFGILTAVPTGHVCVVTQFGKVVKPLNPGIHAKAPLGIQSTQCLETRVLKEEADASAASKDLQTVTARVALNFKLQEDMVDDLYQNIGTDYRSRIIVPALQESVKSGTAQFTAEELITKRSDVREAIKTALSQRLNGTGLIVTDFNIVDFGFSDSFDAAIEAKVTAEQNALAAKNKLEETKYRAQQEVEAAKGKAEAQRIEGLSLKENPQVIELRAIEKWNGQLPTYTGSGNVPFLNISK